jgi:hypothetical protein
MIPLTQRKIFLFWAPLAATWLMMSVEGPFLAAVIARLADPKANLAAYGVAYSFALIVEAPIIMIMSASTALVAGRTSYYRLRNFTFALNGLITAFMLIVLWPPVFRFLTERLIGLPPAIAEVTHTATLILLPWPGAIGYRRFFQGLLIRSGRTRLVAYGTVLRLTTMAGVATVLYVSGRVPGACVGAAALASGVVMEALASRIMAHGTARRLRALEEESAPTYREIAHFYHPLAMTSILALGVNPMVTFFMGQSRHPLESLAVLPVVVSFGFIFRCFGLSFQETGVALMGEGNAGFQPLRRFALILAAATSTAYALVTLTPLVNVWFSGVSGLSAELSAFAVGPARIILLLPALEVLLSLQRSILVNVRRTGPITWATAVEVLGIVAVLAIAIRGFNAVGAVAACTGFLVGKLAHNLSLLRPCFSALGPGSRRQFFGNSAGPPPLQLS